LPPGDLGLVNPTDLGLYQFYPAKRLALLRRAVGCPDLSKSAEQLAIELAAIFWRLGQH
jgi:hypothetical protein